MKITISRSFSKKIQLKTYEPVDSFCAAQAELEVEDESPNARWEYVAKELDKFCREEVEKTLHQIRPSLIADEPKVKPEYIQRTIDLEEAKQDSDEANSIE
jgi:hypothetical protein